MSSAEEPRPNPADPKQDDDTTETVSLVDLFDKLDRAAFERALAQRDSRYPLFSNR